MHISHMITYFAYMLIRRIYLINSSMFCDLFLSTARIEDDDPGYGSDAWTTKDPRTGQARDLRADRWHRIPPEEVIDGDDCSGIRCQIWERAKSRSLMTHRLAGGGCHNLGYDALPWDMILHGNCGKYGQYKVVSYLPDKIARYLFEFDSELYASHDLPEIPDDRSEISIHSLLHPVQVKIPHIFAYLSYMTYVCIYQVRGLLDTLQLLESAEGEGHLRMYSTLLIGHKKYAGEQRVACWPFKGKTLQKSNRQDLVFARPPGIDKGGFQLRIDNVWFCRVLFLFSMESRNDQGIKRHDCAFVSVLDEYKGWRRPGCPCICIFCFHLHMF